MAKTYNKLINTYTNNKDNTELNTLINKIYTEESFNKRSEFFNTLVIHSKLSDDEYTKFYIATILQELMVNDNKDKFKFNWDEITVTKEVLELFDNVSAYFKSLNDKVFKKNLTILSVAAIAIFAVTFNYFGNSYPKAIISSAIFVVFYSLFYFMFENNRNNMKISKEIISKADPIVVSFVKKHLVSL